MRLGRALKFGLWLILALFTPHAHANDPTEYLPRWTVRADMSEVLFIMKESGIAQPPWEPEYYHAIDRSRDVLSMVVEHNGRIAGVMIYERYGKQIHIRNLGVLPGESEASVVGTFIEALTRPPANQRRNSVFIEVPTNRPGLEQALRGKQFNTVESLQGSAADNQQEIHSMRYIIKPEEVPEGYEEPNWPVESPNFYDRLAVKPSATSDEITNAYFEKVTRPKTLPYVKHLLKEAFDVLINPRLRQAHDDFINGREAFPERYGKSWLAHMPLKPVNNSFDFYKRLGIPFDATDLEIESAYERLKTLYANLPDALDRIGEAYTMLINPSKRKRFNKEVSEKYKAEQLEEIAVTSEKIKSGVHPFQDNLYLRIGSHQNASRTQTIDDYLSARASFKNNQDALDRIDGAFRILSQPLLRDSYDAAKKHHYPKDTFPLFPLELHPNYGSKNPYERLGIPKDASDLLIRLAYDQLDLRIRAEVEITPTERAMYLKAIDSAETLLLNTKARQNYDETQKPWNKTKRSVPISPTKRIKPTPLHEFLVPKPSSYNFYVRLGAPEHVAFSELEAYYLRAMAKHPGSFNRLSRDRIQLAYDFLKDARLRDAYDNVHRLNYEKPHLEQRLFLPRGTPETLYSKLKLSQNASSEDIKNAIDIELVRHADNPNRRELLLRTEQTLLDEEERWNYNESINITQAEKDLRTLEEIVDNPNEREKVLQFVNRTNYYTTKLSEYPGLGVAYVELLHEKIESELKEGTTFDGLKPAINLLEKLKNEFRSTTTEPISLNFFGKYANQNASAYFDAILHLRELLVQTVLDQVQNEADFRALLDGYKMKNWYEGDIVLYYLNDFETHRLPQLQSEQERARYTKQLALSKWEKINSTIQALYLKGLEKIKNATNPTASPKSTCSAFFKQISKNDR